MKVSVILVTWNVEGFIRQCLDSLRQQTFKDFEIIVVDNGSRDQTTSIVEKEYPEVLLVSNRENEGFCRANNRGIRLSGGEYVLTLNADVVLDKGFLQCMVEAMEGGSQRMGMLSGKMLRQDEITLDSAGLILSKSRRFYDRGAEERDRGQHDREREVFGVCAGAGFYRRAMLEDISTNGEYFDNHFFFLGEDFDISWRAQLYGWKGEFLPSAVCYHLRGSSEHGSKFRQYLSFKNRYLLMLKNDSLVNILLASPWLIPYDACRFIYLIFTNRLVWRGIREVFQALPDIWRKRRLIKAHTVVSNRYIREWLK